MSSALVLPGRFASLVKIEHTVFALPFAYVGALLCQQKVPSASDLIWITIAMLGAILFREHHRMSYVSVLRPGRSGRKSASANGTDPTAVREWAKSQGIEVKDRGRVPAELVVKFKAATGQ